MKNRRNIRKPYESNPIFWLIGGLLFFAGFHNINSIERSSPEMLAHFFLMGIGAIIIIFGDLFKKLFDEAKEN